MPYITFMSAALNRTSRRCSNPLLKAASVPLLRFVLPNHCKLCLAEQQAIIALQLSSNVKNQKKEKDITQRKRDAAKISFSGNDIIEKIVSSAGNARFNPNR